MSARDLRYMDPVEADVLREERLRTVLELRAQGTPWKAIAEKLDMTERHLLRLVQEATAEMRRKNRELSEQRFLEHDARLEWLYGVVASRIHAYATSDPPVVDEKLVARAVNILERQAKLHGLDKKAGRESEGKNHYLDDDRTIGDVLKDAKALGVEIPAEFEIVAGVRDADDSGRAAG